jgi:hypothetical protein
MTRQAFLLLIVNALVVDIDCLFQHAHPSVCDDAPLLSVGVNRDRQSLSCKTNDSSWAHKPSTPYRRESIDDLRLDWPDLLPRVDTFDDISTVRTVKFT